MRIVPPLLLLLLLALVAAVAAQTRCPGSPNQCSLHGSCVLSRQGDHVCNCQWGYHAADCAKSTSVHVVLALIQLAD